MVKEYRRVLKISGLEYTKFAESGWTLAGVVPKGKEAPVLLTTVEGEKVALFHYAKGSQIPDFAREADILICCNPHALPAWARTKHVFPDWRGILWWEVDPENPLRVACSTSKEDWIGYGPSKQMILSCLLGAVLGFGTLGVLIGISNLVQRGESAPEKIEHVN
jgi:hypothetical protein